MKIIICILLAVTVIAILKALSYFYALCGVLHYLMETYNDEVDDERIKKFTIEAVKNIRW